ncbi:MAG: hypothetical protein R2706_06960 [Acidimicrobiales bacterium]
MSNALVGRTLTVRERDALIASIATDGLGATLEKWVNVNSQAASIDRLYRAFFLRLPDAEGLRYWIGQRPTATSWTISLTCLRRVPNTSSAIPT